MTIEIRDGKITDKPRVSSRVKKKRWRVKSQKDLDALLLKLNQKMIEDRIRLTARSLKACCRITQEFDIILPFEPAERPALPNNFSPLEVRTYIEQYFNRLYGSRARITYEIGRVAFKLRGDYYALRCPLTYNKVVFVCEPEKFRKDWRPDVCNMVDLIEDMTPSLALSLRAEDIVKLGAALSTGLEAFASLRAIKDFCLIEDAIGDFDAAVMHLTANQKLPGQSQWATLQGVEKLLKAFLVSSGQEAPKTHAIQALVDLAVAQGLPAPPQEYVRVIECSAKVRYGQGDVSVQRAEAAHLISLEIAAVVARSIGQQQGKKMPHFSGPIIDGLPMKEWFAGKGIEMSHKFGISGL